MTDCATFWSMNEPGKQGTASSEPAPRELDDLVSKPWLPQVLVAIAMLVIAVTIWMVQYVGRDDSGSAGFDRDVLPEDQLGL